jgi:hypothetical protein
MGMANQVQSNREVEVLRGGPYGIVNRIAEAFAVTGRRPDKHRVAPELCDSIQLTHGQARVAQRNMRGGNQSVLV